MEKAKRPRGAADCVVKNVQELVDVGGSTCAELKLGSLASKAARINDSRVDQDHRDDRWVGIAIVGRLVHVEVKDYKLRIEGLVVEKSR